MIIPIKELKEKIEKLKEHRPKTKEEFKLSVRLKTLKEVSNFITLNYLNSKNDFCEGCELKIKCSECPMTEAMLELNKEIKGGVVS